LKGKYYLYYGIIVVIVKDVGGIYQIHRGEKGLN